MCGLLILRSLSGLNLWLVCLHILVSIMFWHGCSKVPGYVTLTRVAPSDGGRPVTGAPRCSSPCPQWSMMLSAISETCLLLLLLIVGALNSMGFACLGLVV